MNILEFTQLTKAQQKEALAQMRKADWDAAQYLCDLCEQNRLDCTFGADTKVLVLYLEDTVAAFCTFADRDEIDNPHQKPWVGFVYTFPTHRGHRYSGALVEYAKSLAKEQGYKQIFVSSEEVGLYEKYGFRFLEKAQSIHGYETQIFVCDL